MQALKDVMGPDQDIPGPEISAGSRVMAWWFDEYSKFKGFSPACVTGMADCKHCHVHQCTIALLLPSLARADFQLVCGYLLFQMLPA